MGKIKYFTEEERKAARRENQKRYYQEHKEKHKESVKRWEKNHRETKRESYRRWREKHKVEARADNLLTAYNQKDRKANRGQVDLTAQWIVERIFSQPCAHCGKTGWEVIGCNRIDNSKPHTMDNVEPCCEDCNNKLNYEEMRKKVYQYTLDGKLVYVWKSIQDCGKNEFCCGHVSQCCNGNRKTHKGYKWSFEPL